MIDVGGQHRALPSIADLTYPRDVLQKRADPICLMRLPMSTANKIAGLTESKPAHVWEDLEAKVFGKGAASSFPKSKITGKLRDHAIASTFFCMHKHAIRTVFATPVL
jgi:hypothetical protein